MDNAASKPDTTVLFVDDDPSFLETVRAAILPLSGGQWNLLVAPSADKALELIRSQFVHLAVLDVNMPGIGGLELLQNLARDFPNLPKVLLTSAPDAATRLAGLETGAALFLEKPGSLAGMESVYATLNELVKWHRKQDPLHGPRKAGLVEIVRLECASGNSRLVDVVAGNVSGLVYIKSGSILHSESPGRRGQSAFTFLASHPGAEFMLKEFVDPPERSITRQWEFLVLEAFQLREQLAQAAQEAKRKELAGRAPISEPPASHPPASPQSGALRDIAAASPGRTAPPTRTAPSVSIPEKLRLASTGLSRDHAPATHTSASQAVSQPRQPPAAPPPVQPVQLQPAPVTLPIGHPPTPDAPPQIEEMLVCTHQNEVLYEWRCTHTDARFQLLDNLRLKAGQISQHLSLAFPSRIEFQGNDGRLLARFQTDAAILVRSATKQRPIPSNVPPFNRPASDWLAGQSDVQGLLACGLMRSNRTIVSCSYAAEFPSQSLNTLWRATHDVADLVRDQNLAPWLVRWIFDQAQLYWIRRLDGRALGLLIRTQPDEVDTARARKTFLEFSSLLES